MRATLSVSYTQAGTRGQYYDTYQEELEQQSKKHFLEQHFSFFSFSMRVTICSLHYKFFEDA
jgi:hypothetical protein